MLFPKSVPKLGALAVLALALQSAPVAAQSVEGEFLFLWTPDPDGKHRDMIVKSPLTFNDAAGRAWHVPVDAVVNGASIPAWLWSFAGSPYVGTYRRASVFHDHYCDLQNTPAYLVHGMFRDVMYLDRTPWWEAESKFAAVAAYDVAATALGGGCGIRESAAQRLADLAADEEAAAMGLVLSDELLATAERFGEAVPEDAAELEDRKSLIADLAGLSDPRLYSALVDYRFRPGRATFQRIEPVVLATESMGVRTELAVELARATTPQGEPVADDCLCEE